MTRKAPSQSAGVNISGSQVHVGGDIVGRDKVITPGFSPTELAELVARFAHIYEMIEKRPPDPDLDPHELRDTLALIESEVMKGPEANPAKVERWLRFLASMADDIFQVTAATLAHPLAGAAKAIQLIAQRAQRGDL